MIIDKNEKAMESMKYFNNDDETTGHKILKEFLDEVKKSGQDYCSCNNIKCRYHGKCMECVLIHRGHDNHLPNCFHNMINEKIKGISKLTEHSFKEYLEK